MPPSILRPLAALAALAGLAAYATIMLKGPQGLSSLEEKHRQIQSLEKDNADLQRAIEEKKRRIRSLTTDRDAQAIAIEKEQGKLPPGQTRFMTPGQHIAPPSATTQR